MCALVFLFQCFLSNNDQHTTDNEIISDVVMLFSVLYQVTRELRHRRL